jgi:uncharacterized membrane protein YbhN (UPF0104 family)
MPRVSKSAVRWIRLTLAAVTLIVLMVKIGHTKPLERLAAANPWFILLAIVVVMVDGVTRAWNWTQLLRAMHVAPRVRYGTVLGIHWGGAFLGQIVPSTVGTDALRVMLATRKIGGRASAHWAALVMLNLISLTTGCAAALACALWLALFGHGQAVRPVAVVLFLGAITGAAGGYWMLRSQRGLILRILRTMRGPWRKLRRGLRRFMHRVLVFERQHVRVAPIVIIALVTLLTRASVYALVGLGVGLVLPFPAWVALVPAYMLSGLIPYSVSGYGGDQAAIVYILTGFAANAGVALAFALIVPLMSLAYNMFGGFSVLFGNLDASAPLPASAPVEPGE